jgi:hypothetical protein
MHPQWRASRVFVVDIDVYRDLKHERNYQMSLKPTSIGAVLALLFSSTAMANQSLLSDDTEINDRSTASIIATLAEQDIRATRVEEWGGMIRVDTDDESGANRVLFVDKDTLRPVSEAPMVGTQLSVQRPNNIYANQPLNDTPLSLVESDD